MLAIGPTLVCILTPLIYVAIHVKQTESVGCFGGHSVSREVTISTAPSHLIEVAPSGIFLRFSPTSTRILPLSSTYSFRYQIRFTYFILTFLHALLNMMVYQATQNVALHYVTAACFFLHVEMYCVTSSC